MSKVTTTLSKAALPIGIFKHRGFVFVWSSATFVAMGTQTEAVVLGWFVLTLTDSPLLVGLMSAARMALNLLALFAGAMADRLPRQKLLAAVEFSLAILGLVMITLIITDLLEVWHVFIIAMFAGMVRVFQMPTAQSLIADTLPAERIGNGVAFNVVGMNIAMVIGPLIGGLLFKEYGPQGAFTAIAALYFISGWFALFVNVSRDSAPRPRESVYRTVVGGLKYVKGVQVLWATLILAIIVESSGWTFHTTLLPIFARDVMDTDSAGLGLLLFAFGIGAVAGSLGLALFHNQQHVGKLMIGAVVLWHVSILAFSTSHAFYLSMAILAITGMGFASTRVFILTALLRTAEPNYRGRIMSLRSLVIYAFALGSINSGAMAGLWGAPLAASIVGIAGIVLVLTLAVFTPKLRQF